jgi:hypothetical protein
VRRRAVGERRFVQKKQLRGIFPLANDAIAANGTHLALHNPTQL